MAVTLETFVPPKNMEITQQMQYTSSNVRSVVDKCTVTNTGTTNISFSLNVIAEGGTASASNTIIKTRTVLPNQTYNCPELVGHSLQPNSFISTIASASGLTLMVSGRVQS